MYGEAFCRAYNLLGWNYFPEAFGEQLLRWLAARDARVRDALDLACGTGALCEVLRAAGIRPVGVDLSEGMIAVARERCPEIEYVVGDMTAFRRDGAFDLITCTGDAVNHLPEAADVSRMFACAGASLRPGGLLVFDLLGEAEIPSGEPLELDAGGGETMRFSVEQTGADRVTLSAAMYREGRLRFEERIRERLYPPEDVCALLEAAGLRVIQCGHRLLEDGGDPVAAWYIAAGKPLWGNS